MIREWAPTIALVIVGLVAYVVFRRLDPAGRRGRTAMSVEARTALLLGFWMAATFAQQIPGLILGPESAPATAAGGGWSDPGGICPSFAPPTVSVAPLGPVSSGASSDPSALADRWIAVETAYIDGYNRLYATTNGTPYFATFAEARATYARQLDLLARLEDAARQTPFPAGVETDVMHLLQHVAEEKSLIGSLLAAEDESCGWDINVRILEADRALDEARVQLGRRVGLDYPDASGTPATSVL